MSDNYMTTRDVARLLQVSASVVAKWRSAGEGPPYYKPFGRVLYAEREVHEWVRGEERV